MLISKKDEALQSESRVLRVRSVDQKCVAGMFNRFARGIRCLAVSGLMPWMYLLVPHKQTPRRNPHVLARVCQSFAVTVWYCK